MTFEQVMEIAGRHDTEKNAGLMAFARDIAAAERERCASLCESIARDTYGMTDLREYGECANAIRKGETPPL